MQYEQTVKHLPNSWDFFRLICLLRCFQTTDMYSFIDRTFELNLSSNFLLKNRVLFDINCLMKCIGLFMYIVQKSPCYVELSFNLIKGLNAFIFLCLFTLYSTTQIFKMIKTDIFTQYSLLYSLYFDLQYCIYIHFITNIVMNYTTIASSAKLLPHKLCFSLR